MAAAAKAVLGRLADVGCVAWGGYDGAERRRLVVGKEELVAPELLELGADGGVVALEVRGSFAFADVSHRDFLGATLNTGIDRRAVGDIIVLEDGGEVEGAQLLVTPELSQFLQSELLAVARQPVETVPIDLLDLRPKELRVETATCVETSLRIDTIVSAGFKMSRSQASDAVKAGDVRLNWTKVPKGSALVKTGDVISFDGKGRVQVGEWELTRKGKYAVEIVRFV